MTETTQDMPSSPASWRAFLNSISFERWLLAWLSILLCHMFIYAISYHLYQVAAVDAQHGIPEGFLLPVFSSLLVLVIVSLVWQRQSGLARWSEAMIALHSTFALILLLLSQAHYFTIPWKGLLEISTELGGTVNVGTLSAYAAFQTIPYVVLAVYSLSLALTMFLAQARKPLFVLSQSLSLVGLLLALLLMVNSSLSGGIRLSQPGAPDVEFAWQTQINNCVDYRFAAAGVRAIWLGDEGLVSVDPMNYGTYCDAMPRLLRVITSDEQEQRYLVGKVGWVNLDAWWLTVALALLLPLVFFYAETWLRQFQVNAVDETHIAAQESR